MTLEKIYNDVLFMGDKFETDEEWKQRRFEGVGGTETSSILGYNKYKSAMELYFEKTTGVDSFVNSFAARRGKALEPLIADVYAERTGNIVPEMSDNISFASLKQPYSLGTLDRLAWDEHGIRVVEIKTVGSRGIAAWDGGIPMMYMIQLQKYIAIIREIVSYVYPDYDKEFSPIVGDMVASMYDDDVVIYKAIQCPPHIEEVLYLADKKFWIDCVKANEPPTPNTLDELRMLWKDQYIEGGFAVANNVIVNTIVEYYKTKELIKEIRAGVKPKIDELKNKVDRLEYDIIDVIRDKEGIAFDDAVLVSWRPTSAGNRVLRINRKEVEKLI